MKFKTDIFGSLGELFRFWYEKGTRMTYSDQTIEKEIGIKYPSVIYAKSSNSSLRFYESPGEGLLYKDGSERRGKYIFVEEIIVTKNTSITVKEEPK